MRWRRTVTELFPLPWCGSAIPRLASAPRRHFCAGAHKWPAIPTFRRSGCAKSARASAYSADRSGRGLGGLLCRDIPAVRFRARLEKVAGDAGQCAYAKQQTAFIDEKARRMIGWRLVDV